MRAGSRKQDLVLETNNDLHVVCDLNIVFEGTRYARRIIEPPVESQIKMKNTNFHMMVCKYLHVIQKTLSLYSQGSHRQKTNKQRSQIFLHSL